MKRLAILVCFFSLTASSVNAQRTKLFRSIIHTNEGERIDGILYDVTDSTVRYVPNQADFVRQLRAGEMPQVLDIHWNAINRIVIRRKGYVGRGTLTGTGIGLGTGLLTALAVRSDGGGSGGINIDLSGLIRAVALVTLPIAGAGIGTIFSFIPERVIRIRQSAATYKSVKAELKRLSFIYHKQVNSFAPTGVTPLNQYP